MGPAPRWTASPWLAVVLALCLSLPKLNQGDFNVDTGRYAAVSLQAWRSAAAGDLGALITLREAGDVHYFNKPPMAFWLHGPALLAVGPQLWAARLPCVIAVAAMAWGVAWLTRRACEGTDADGGSAGRGEAQARRAGVLAGCVLATTYAFTSLSHAISPDLWQAAFMLCAIVPVVEALRRQRGTWLALSGIGVGLALLVKPFIALLIPVILVLWLAWERRWRWLGWAIAGVGVAALVAAPWHLAMIVQHGRDFLDQYFGREIVSRAVGEHPGLKDGAGGPLYYARVIAEIYWPWLPGLVLALVWAARGRRPHGGGVPDPWRPWVRLGIVWFIVFAAALLVYPDKRPRYLVGLYAPASWLIGMWLATLSGRGRRAVDVGLPLVTDVMLAGAALVAVLPVRVHGDVPRHWREFFEWHIEAGEPVLWEGGFGLPESSRLYLQEARWPEPTHDGLGRLIAQPPPGALIVYHARHAIQPGEGEETVFRSANGDLFVTRLLGARWLPRGEAVGG